MTRSVLKPKAVARWLRDLFRYLTFRYRFSDSRGVYRSFDEAMKSAPFGALHGYDHERLAGTYLLQDSTTLAEFEYPLLYHLEKLLAVASRRITVLDFGGNTGIHYLRLRNKLDLAGVDWVVLDLPAITRAGLEVCRGIPNVRFITALEQLGSTTVDVLIANGSLQYVADFSQSLLQRLRPPPRCLLIGQLLVYPGETFVTLQNGGNGAFYPQYVFNRADYVAAILAQGYVLADQWNDYSNACSIPFHPERSVSCSAGFCFRQRNNEGGAP